MAGAVTLTTQLIALAVVTPLEVQTLAEIRNECSGSFAHDNSTITPFRQRRWWQVMRGRVHAWLYATPLDDVIGYGVVRQEADGRWWNSIAVRPQWRGRGFGAQITADVLDRHPWPVWAQVRLDNPAALRMHHTREWEEIERDDTLVTLRSRLRPRTGKDAR